MNRKLTFLVSVSCALLIALCGAFKSVAPPTELASIAVLAPAAPLVRSPMSTMPIKAPVFSGIDCDAPPSSNPGWSYFVFVTCPEHKHKDPDCMKDCKDVYHDSLTANQTEYCANKALADQHFETDLALCNDLYPAHSAERAQCVLDAVAEYDMWMDGYKATSDANIQAAKDAYGTCALGCTCIPN